MVMHCVGPVGKTMQLMSSGSAVMYAKDGSTASVLRLPLQELSISSSTSAQHAVTSERESRTHDGIGLRHIQNPFESTVASNTLKDMLLMWEFVGLAWLTFL